MPPLPADTIGYNDAEFKNSDGPKFHGAATAWVAGHTGQGSIIGIIDTGIFQGNSEFAGRISANSTDIFTSRHTVEGEGTHGSMVAMVAAAANDGAGTVGIAYGSTIMAIRSDEPGTCASSDDCSFGDLTNAIDWAVDHHATVINMSLGGSSASASEIAAIKRASDAGIVVVVAAGNDGSARPDPFARSITGSGFDNVIIAGSVNSQGKISSFSDKAQSRSDFYLAALGDDVTVYLTGSGWDIDSHYAGPGYYSVSGTSFSAPQIAGAVALLKEAFPSLTGAEIVQLLFETAQDVGAPGVDDVYGHGILDIRRAFEPVGTTTLADKGETPLTIGDTAAVGSPAMGDALNSMSLKTLVLDKYRRAFSTDIGATMRGARVSNKLYGAIGAQTRYLATGTGDSTAAYTIDDSHRRFGFDGANPLSLTAQDANVTQVLAARVAMKLSPHTTLGFTYAEGSNGLVMQLQGQDRPAFMIAQQAGSDDGTFRSDNFSFALRQQLGRWGLTLATTQGEILSGDGLWLANRNYGSRTDDAVQHLGLTFDRRWGGLQATVGFDWMREARTVLGARFHDAFGGGGANTMFVDATASWEFAPGVTIAGAMRNGWTRPDSSSVIESSSMIQSRSWSLDLEKQGLFGKSDRIGFRVSQPLRVESGGLNLSLPISYSYATESATFGTIPLSLAPDGREMMGELAWHGWLWDGSASASFYFRRDPGNYASLPDDKGVALRWSKQF